MEHGGRAPHLPLRLRTADDLLAFTQLPASEIAGRIGYTNANYFYTLYRKYKRVYPSEAKTRAGRAGRPPAHSVKGE